MSSRGDRWRTTLSALADPSVKVAYARAELREGPPDEVAAALDALCRACDEHDDVARAALGAFVPVLVDPANLDILAPIRAAALAAQFPATERLLRCSSRQGHLLDEPRPAREPLRTLTLGERRALARKPSRQVLAKLLRDPHPLVVRILLANPRITEDDVVVMAAHRPAWPEVVVEIAKAWSRRSRVRLALVLQPGAPPAVTVPMLGLLSRPELDAVLHAPDVPPLVRRTAAEWLERRSSDDRSDDEALDRHPPSAPSASRSSPGNTR